MPLRNFFRRVFRSSDAQGQAGRRMDAARPDQASGVPLNVKPGDMARVVGVPDNFMALVEVIEPTDSTGVVQPAWRCKALSTMRAGGRVAAPGQIVYCADRCLRPLYDGDATDEILQLVGLPTFPLERQEA